MKIEDIKKMRFLGEENKPHGWRGEDGFIRDSEKVLNYWDDSTETGYQLIEEAKKYRKYCIISQDPYKVENGEWVAI